MRTSRRSCIPTLPARSTEGRVALLVLLGVVAILAAAASLRFGSQSFSLGELIGSLFEDGQDTVRRILLYVRLPLIRPVIINCIVLAVIGTLKAFEGPFVLTNGGPGYASELMATYMYKTAFNNMEYGYGSALSLIIVVECIAVFGLINALTKRKE